MEVLIILVVVFALFYFGDFDFLGPILGKLSETFGWQDPPIVDENIGLGLDSILNSTAIVKSLFSKSAEGMPFEGRVSVRGSDWKAEQISGDLPLSIGEEVIVRRIEGIKLYVEIFSRGGV